MHTALPAAIYKYISTDFLTHEESVVFSLSCKTHYKDAQTLRLLKGHLKGVGLKPSLIDLLDKDVNVQNYASLYHTLKKLPREMREQLSELWELYCLTGDLQLIKLVTPKSISTEDVSALHLCAASGKAGALKYAVENFELNYFAQTQLAETITNFALMSQNLETIEYCKNTLLVSPGTRTDGRNPLHAGILSMQITIVDEALKNFKKDSKDKLGKNALLISASEGSTGGIKYSVGVLNLTLESTDSESHNLFHCLVLSHSLPAVKYALKRAPLSMLYAKNTSNKTPLQLARDLNQFDIARELSSHMMPQ